MNRLRIHTPARLHFGPLAYGAGAERQFGGLGLMVLRPGIVLEAVTGLEWSATGALSERVLRVAKEVVARLVELNADDLRPDPLPLNFRVLEAPPEHVGLGTGTQLSLAVAHAVTMLAGWPKRTAPALAQWVGRGLRSSVGIHGFDHGGLIVEGGHKREGGIAPLLASASMPPTWNVLVVVPPVLGLGLHGADEVAAFASIAPMPESETNRICRLVLLGILPAVAEDDLETFGEALTEIQQHVGAWFAPAQGGVFASKALEDTVIWLRKQGLKGVGQSSWGPTVYGFSTEDEAWRKDLLTRLHDRFDGHPAGVWTTVSNGASYEQFR